MFSIKTECVESECSMLALAMCSWHDRLDRKGKERGRKSECWTVCADHPTSHANWMNFSVYHKRLIADQRMLKTPDRWILVWPVKRILCEFLSFCSRIQTTGFFLAASTQLTLSWEDKTTLYVTYIHEVCYELEIRRRLISYTTM